MSREAISRSLKRCTAAQPILNPFILIDSEGAMRRAETAAAGSLAGTPIALKDLIDQSGLPTTAGSSFYSQVPEHSAPVVDRLEEAGATIVARTGLHEFAFGFTSENEWFGPVRNPWDPATSPGGSSGGSAAAVAAGCVPIAIGTDTGGSVRVPAALCGIFGLKVTHGRIPLTGVFPLAGSLDTVGPMATNTSDLTAAYLAMAGHHESDPWAQTRPVDTPGERISLEGLRVGVLHPWVDRPLDAVLAETFEATLSAMERDGARIVHVTDETLAPDEVLPIAAAPEIAAVHEVWFQTHPERYGNDVRRRLEGVFAVSVADAGRVVSWRRQQRAAARRIFQDVDLLATPTTAIRRKVIGEEMVDVGGHQEHHRPPLWAFTLLVNHLGCPAAALPVPVTPGPPASLQLVGPWWSEALLLEVSARLERLGIACFVKPPSAVTDEIG